AIDMLENEYRPDMTLDEALNLITSVVERTGNPEPTIQVGYISLDNPVFRRETINGVKKKST
ncbi:MAG: hypothetical protein QW467_06450, partial [Candidatus Caldarchaeum sp.]